MLRSIANLVVRCERRLIHTTALVSMPIKVGDKIPDVDLYESTPGNKVNAAQLVGSGKHVIFGVPGAFTPGCSKTHLPGYVEKFSDLTAKGVDSIICVAVNDPFVMEAWGEEHHAAGKVKMLADTCGEFTRAIDVELDATAILGNKRCKRFALVVKDGVVSAVEVEPDGTGLTCSLAPEIMKHL